MLIPLNREEILKFASHQNFYFDSDHKTLIINGHTHYLVSDFFRQKSIGILKRKLRDINDKKEDKRQYYTLFAHTEFLLDAGLYYIKSFGMDLEFNYIDASNFNNILQGQNVGFYNITPKTDEAHAMFLLYFSDHFM